MGSPYCIHLLACTKESVLVDKVRVNEHSDVNKESEPAKHISKHLNHKFTWEVLTTEHSWLKRTIKEAFYIARSRPELNKQVETLDLTLFPREQVLPDL